MARSGYLYRRSSGIYVVRICVPIRYRSFIGRGEIHVSTSARNSTTAKLTAFRVLSHWQQRLLELEMDLLKVVSGSPLLAGDGHVRLSDVALELGIDPKTLLQEASNHRVPLMCVADGWHGIEVDDLHKIDREADGAYILNDVDQIGGASVVTGELVLFDTRSATQSFLDSGEYVGEIFFRDSKRRRAVFFDPGHGIGVNSLLLLKTDAERIRVSLRAGVTPSMLKAEIALRLRNACLER